MFVGYDRDVDALDALQQIDDARALVLLHVDGGERTERSMMSDVGIGYRQDDTGRAGAITVVQYLLKVDHIRLAVREVLVIHAVIGCHHQRATGRVELADIAVEHFIEIVGDR